MLCGSASPPGESDGGWPPYAHKSSSFSASTNVRLLCRQVPAAMRLTLRRLIIAITFLSLLAMATRVAVDSDTWWHLRAGAWMVEHGQVLNQELFTSTFAGQPYDYPAWLSQVALYLAYAGWSFAGVNLLTALLVTAAFVLVYATCTGGVYLRAGAVILGTAASAVFWSARPHIFSFVLAAAMLYVLESFRRRDVNRLWVLPVLIALWANSHPGYAIGFILLAVTTAGEGLKALLGRGSWRAVAWLAGIGLVCVAALLLSPYGTKTLLYPFRVVGIELLQDRIQEWQSPNFHLREAQVTIWLWLATVAAIGLSRRTLDLTDLLLLGAMFYLALLAGRNVALLALVAPPVLTRHAQAIIDDWRGRYPRLVARLDGQVDRESRLAPVVNWALLALVAVAAGLKMSIPLDPVVNATLAQRGLPTAAADFIASARPSGPLYNPYEWGGYLVWRLYPDYPVFIDGRTDVYDADFFAEYLRLAAGLPDWAAILERHGVRLVLAPTGSPLAGTVQADGGWQRVYGDEVAEVYAQRP